MLSWENPFLLMKRVQDVATQNPPVISLFMYVEALLSGYFTKKKSFFLSLNLEPLSFISGTSNNLCQQGFEVVEEDPKA